MVTSVRDGMNLVSHEYVAAQSETNNHDAGSSYSTANIALGDTISNTSNTALVRTIICYIMPITVVHVCILLSIVVL
jgi:hypothetical protein